MDLELKQELHGRDLACWQELLQQEGLEPDRDTDRIALLWDQDTLAATGSRRDNLFKCIAVRDSYQGQDLTANILSALRADAFEAGFHQLFLYTKPRNQYLFQSLFFYPVARTREVLLMESRRHGIEEFLADFPDNTTPGTVGAAVMNCNPFTRGHRYLVETAAAACDQLYVFVLSEDRSTFSAAQRMDMVRLGTRDLPNVTVLPTGPYLISNATFPTYFLKDRDQAASIHCRLDIEIFIQYFVPKFGITRRFVGTEPLSPMTALYNDALRQELPRRGVELIEIPRLESRGVPVSATRVRQCIDQGNSGALSEFLPDTTLEYLKNHNLIG